LGRSESLGVPVDDTGPIAAESRESAGENGRGVDRQPVRRAFATGNLKRSTHDPMGAGSAK